MNKKIKILCTLGPASLNSKIIKKLDELGVDIFRINLSHTDEKNIEAGICKIRKNTGKPICLDSEGAQVRNGIMSRKKVRFFEDSTVKIHKKEIIGDATNLYLRPDFILDQLYPGDLISVDFDNLLLKVCNKNEAFVETKVICGGIVGSNKAVIIDRDIELPPFTPKDILAVKIGLKYGVEYIALSFANRKEDIIQLRDLAKDKIKIISKIESTQGLSNLDEILSVSDAILIDRGDLSRQEPLEIIPFFQKAVIQRAKEKNMPVYVATNLLETMVNKRNPSRAEVNDVVNTLLDGTDGLVLAAETAIGKYPVECLTMMKRIIKAHEVLSNRHSTISILNNNPARSLTLVEPHGGRLVDCTNFNTSKDKLKSLKKLFVEDTVLVDAEQIATGAYSPLNGFMSRSEIESVLDNCKMPDGNVWTLPIVLQVNDNDIEGLKPKKEVVLLSKKSGEAHAILTISGIYKFDFRDVALRWYHTDDLSHAGVKMLKERGDYFLGGKIELLKRLDTNFKEFTLTPEQTRHIFEKKGWSTVVGFHTRNVIHRAHEYIQLLTMEKFKIDGLFVHPVVGHKKLFDFMPEVILKSYLLMLDTYYPKGKVLLAAFLTYSRYAGPREAVFTALCRKNFGCTHFIVGRDHTGVGKFYEPEAARKLFEKLGDIGIKPIFFKEVYYCKDCKKLTQNCRHSHEDILKINASSARKMFMKGDTPPEWFMRKEISELVIAEMKNGKEVFVR